MDGLVKSAETRREKLLVETFFVDFLQINNIIGIKNTM